MDDVGNSPSNPNGESTVLPVASLDEGHLPIQIRARSVEDLV